MRWRLIRHRFFFLIRALKRPNMLANPGAERTSKPGLSILIKDFFIGDWKF